MAYPNEFAQVEELLEEHQQLPEPVLLALYYAPERDANDAFLFEVVLGFGGNRVTEADEFMEVTFGAGSGLRIQEDQRLHLLLTNPNEFNVALRQNWQSFQEIRQAVRSGRYQSLYLAPEYGETLLNALRNEPAIGQSLAASGAV